ncbi:carbohydrate binding domain-containing protein [Flavobacterium sp. 7A]|uniref:carbohydrate binding domain-containing protein n=1 Tax=Flavobacterium sp. 7A TaxID=2940571 RepID=UPI002226DFF2|nr:carbohydrate binding domain-containing protein [Flavobacterium sp. 7A]MCW2120739.1 hypothetical protein [Flavobacterium sp. 7A]
MKKIVNIVVPMLLVFFAIGCGNQDYIIPSSFSDAGFYSTYGKSEYKSAVVGSYSTFQDVSQGAIYHTWEIEEGNEFLKGPIPQNAKTYENLIETPGKTLTEDKTINVLFKKGNITSKVKMFDVFNEPVTFRRGPAPSYANNPGGDVVAVLQTEGPWVGKYVLELDIIVDVFDTVVPDLSISQNGTALDYKQAGSFIDLKAGDKLDFKDLSALVPNTSRPTGRGWKITNIDTGVVIVSSTLEAPSIIFKKLGTFKATLTASRASSENIPGSTTLYEIPLQFRVGPSDQPFIQTGSIKTLLDGTIQVPLNADIEPGFADQKSFFTVKVNGTTLPINTVVQNATNESTLDIKVSGKLYPADVVTISYAGGGIKSSDDRNLTAFTDKPVNNYDPNLLGTDVGGFEDVFGNTWIANGNNTGTISYSTEQKLGGLTSLKAVATGSQRARFASSGAGVSKVFNLIGGTTYTVKYSRYVKSGTVATGDKIYLITPQTQINSTTQSFDLVNDINQWKTYEFDFTPTDNLSGQSFYIQLNPGEAVVYYDNFYIAPKSVRP